MVLELSRGGNSMRARMETRQGTFDKHGLIERRKHLFGPLLAADFAALLLLRTHVQFVHDDSDRVEIRPRRYRIRWMQIRKAQHPWVGRGGAGGGGERRHTRERERVRRSGWGAWLWHQ